MPKINHLMYFLRDAAVTLAFEQGFVVCVHTGYWGDFRDLSPLHLIPWLMRHTEEEGVFDVYHFGYPWIREAVMLAKGFSNVYLNFCWLHIISQKAAREALDEVLDTVPTNKIIGFGADYHYPAVEKIYGHLVMAKENMAEVVADKIQRGVFDLEEGVRLIRNFLYDNPTALYRLHA